MRLNRTPAAVAAALALAAVAGAGTARAAAVDNAAAPSACRPANHLAKITRDRASSGHVHFRVTLTAASGYAACQLAGSPTDVAFAHHGSALAVRAGRYGDQSAVVTFGPGRPVHFDIQVPNDGHGVRADEATFTLRAPGGEIPGTSVAEGSFEVAPGTVIGPVRPGA
ncbi:DUF4232 domain-containing protein [Streptomyces sp. NPDC051546]|uniref:DUF4232 domain-containing protein n=1 Tax=Streptomyces sp. NPDC051546 TaxID=3365655 RepID=UPI0037AD379F